MTMPGVLRELLGQLVDPFPDLCTGTRRSTRPFEPVIPEYVLHADLGNSLRDVREGPARDDDERIPLCDADEQPPAWLPADAHALA